MSTDDTDCYLVETCHEGSDWCVRKATEAEQNDPDEETPPSAEAHADAAGAVAGYHEAIGWVRRFTERPYKADDARWGEDGPRPEYPPMDDSGWGPGYIRQLDEWRPDAVGEEIAEALAHDYAEEFAGFYRSLDERLGVEANVGR